MIHIHPKYKRFIRLAVQCRRRFYFGAVKTQETHKAMEVLLDQYLFELYFDDKNQQATLQYYPPEVASEADKHRAIRGTLRECSRRTNKYPGVYLIKKYLSLHTSNTHRESYYYR